MGPTGRLQLAQQSCPASGCSASAAGRQTRLATAGVQRAGKASARHALSCQSEASSCADRSPSPHARWHDLDGHHHRTSPPEHSEPSSSGRNNISHKGRPTASSSSSTGKNASTKDAFGYEETWDLPDDDYTPFPGNLPTNEQESLSNGDLFKSSRMYLGVQSSKDRKRYLSQVWVLLFGVGTRDTEGIYSLRAMCRETGVPEDTIIAFQDAEDAERYAGLLEATMEYVPSVSAINVHELLDFCEDSGYKYRFEACGTLLLPPDYNIGLTDWERSLRLREGNFTVLDNEPETKPCEHPAPEEHDCEPPKLHNNAGVGPAPADVEDYRARLERQFQP